MKKPSNALPYPVSFKQNRLAERLKRAGRSLKEPTRVHHTVKRLSRMLGKHGEIAWAAEDRLLEQMSGQVTDEMVVAIEPGG